MREDQVAPQASPEQQQQQQPSKKQKSGSAATAWKAGVGYGHRWAGASLHAWLTWICCCAGNLCSRSDVLPAGRHARCAAHRMQGNTEQQPSVSINEACHSLASAAILPLRPRAPPPTPPGGRLAAAPAARVPHACMLAGRTAAPAPRQPTHTQHFQRRRTVTTITVFRCACMPQEAPVLIIINKVIWLV